MSAHLWGSKKHSDLTVSVVGSATAGSPLAPESRTFALHSFPLLAKSEYFEQNLRA